MSGFAWENPIHSSILGEIIVRRFRFRQPRLPPPIVVTLFLAMAGSSVSAYAADAFDDVVHHAGRSTRDLARDAIDHPADVLRLTDLRPGMQVADILAGDGYYSELVSYIVGPRGHVLLLNNKAFEEFSENGSVARLVNNRLPNVERRTVDLEHLGLGSNTLDAVLLIKVYHDLYWPGPDGPWPKFSPSEVLDQITAALKPGGVLLLVDHSAKSETGHTQAGVLHRIDEQFARADFESRGLRVVAESAILRNPGDPRDQVSYKGPMVGKTDRFVVVFKKNVAPPTR
jgi:predicted methyltransferase